MDVKGGGKGPLLQVDRSGTLATANGQVLFNPRGVEGDVADMPESLYNQGIQEGNDGRTQKTNTDSILSRVQKEIGEKTFTEWGLGILNSLQPQKILQSDVYGLGIRPATFTRSWVVCCALGSPISSSEGAMQSLQEAIGAGCPPQGWESLKQYADELGAYLSQLSQPGPQAERFVQDLLDADEGAGLLRQALSEIQKIRKPKHHKSESAHSSMQVRRLVPQECEFLQGFPRGYLDIQFRGKPASDGPKYKALGNSMAVPVMNWIGKRIKEYES